MGSVSEEFVYILIGEDTWDSRGHVKISPEDLLVLYNLPRERCLLMTRRELESFALANRELVLKFIILEPINEDLNPTAWRIYKERKFLLDREIRQEKIYIANSIKPNYDKLNILFSKRNTLDYYDIEEEIENG